MKDEQCTYLENNPELVRAFGDNEVIISIKWIALRIIKVECISIKYMTYLSSFLDLNLTFDVRTSLSADLFQLFFRCCYIVLLKLRIYGKFESKSNISCITSRGDLIYDVTQHTIF